jgi:hypothetical protein
MKEPTEIVYLKWLDSSGQHGWYRTLPPEDTLPCTSVGWLLRETEDSIAITAAIGGRMKSEGEEDDFNADSIVLIPKVAILQMERHQPPPWLKA